MFAASYDAATAIMPPLPADAKRIWRIAHRIERRERRDAGAPAPRHRQDTGDRDLGRHGRHPNSRCGPSDFVGGQRWAEDLRRDEQVVVRGWQRLTDASVNDAKKIIATATSCTEYLRRTDPGRRNFMASYRNCARRNDGEGVSVEAYKEHLGKPIILITIMDG